MYALRVAVFVLAIILQRASVVTGIMCYECRSASASHLCISDGGSPSECDKKYCTIYRREYLDPAGKVQHFYRSCEDTPTYLNAVIETLNHRTFYRACNQDLCNIGNGIEEFRVEQRNASSSTIYRVPGVGSAGDKTVYVGRPIVLIHLGFALFLREQITQ